MGYPMAMKIPGTRKCRMDWKKHANKVRTKSVVAFSASDIGVHTFIQLTRYRMIMINLMIINNVQKLSLNSIQVEKWVSEALTICNAT